MFDWTSSAIDWVSLYFVFAGLTSVALGKSRTVAMVMSDTKLGTSVSPILHTLNRGYR